MDEFEHQLLRGENGKIRPVIENFALCFSHHPDWRGGLAYDEFRYDIVVTDRAPEGIPRVALDDSAVIDIRRWCERNFLAGNDEKIRAGIDAAARQNCFHPVRDYLHSVKRDRKARIPTFFQQYFGTKADNSIARTMLAEVARMWLVSAVARIFQPGCQVDHLLVLEGAQGIYKSAAFRNLFSSEWFTDQVPSLDSKDASLQLRGKWCIEFGEFDRLSRHESSTVKAYITRQVDTYRKPWGKITSDVPRQSVFCATVNPAQYLVDEQNRRYWPVRCEWVDVQAMKCDRDLIWAEACELYSQGVHWWPEDEALKRMLTSEQQKREVENPFKNRISAWLDREEIQRDVLCDPYSLTTARILEHALQVPAAQWKSAEQHVSTAMRALGYVKDQFGKRRLNYWRAPENEE